MGAQLKGFLQSLDDRFQHVAHLSGWYLQREIVDRNHRCDGIDGGDFNITAADVLNDNVTSASCQSYPQSPKLRAP